MYSYQVFTTKPCVCDAPGKFGSSPLVRVRMWVLVNGSVLERTATPGMKVPVEHATWGLWFDFMQQCYSAGGD